MQDFQMSDYLDSDEAIVTYLSEVLEDGDMRELLRAISYIAKAKGMTQVSHDTGLSRTSLYKALKEDAKPQFDTILKVLKSFGIKLQAVAG